MSNREPGYYWVLWWANPPEESEVAYWTGTEWNLVGEARGQGDDGLAWVGERLPQPAIDIANLRPQGRS